MKKVDLKSAQNNGQTVAVVRSSVGIEALVINVEASRRVYSEGSFQSHEGVGVEVEYVTRDGSAGRREVLAYTQVKELWADYAEAQRQAREYQTRKQDRLEISKADAEVAAQMAHDAYVAAVGQEPGYGAIKVVNDASNWGGRYTPATKYSVELSAGVLEVILKAAQVAA